MPKNVRINVRCNSIGPIRHEKMNGRDVVIVPSATMPDDVVMNGIKYPADEIKKSFPTLDRTPAPLGHPTINGKFVSARDPEGINLGWIGAWNTNVRQENGRVLLDKVIDVERANQSEGGKAVLAALEKGGPIHTSTGLLCVLEAASGDVEYNSLAREIVFDHDAILLNEEGAATPEQGVGMMVNSKGEEIEVINSILEDADRDLDWAVDSLARALERRERVPMLERIKAAVIEAFTPMRETDPQNHESEDTMADDKQLDELSVKVNALTEAQANMSKTIAEAVAEAMKPLTDNLAEMQANQKAKDDAELAEHVATIVKANVLGEKEAGELTLNAARALAAKAKPGKAATINGTFTGAGDDKPCFKLPKGDAA